MKTVIAAALAALCLGAPAGAATFTYQYVGGILTDFYGDGDYFEREWFEGKRHIATLVVDEEKLGQSMRNADLRYAYQKHAGQIQFAPAIESGAIQGWLCFGVDDCEPHHWNATLFSASGSGALFGTMSLKTDEFGDIIEGRVGYHYDSPDGGFGGKNDSLLMIPGGSYSGASGTWTTVSVEGDLFPVPVPVPASGLLLLGGLIGLFRRKTISA